MGEMKKYKVDDEVEVLVSNPQLGEDEWKDGVVGKVTMVHPAHGQRHRPYPLVLVDTVRTYYNNVTETFYEKPNREGFIYKDTIRFK